jgi:hypothetical protein
MTNANDYVRGAGAYERARTVPLPGYGLATASQLRLKACWEVLTLSSREKLPHVWAYMYQHWYR